MKDKKLFLIIMLCFAFLIAGAVALYNTLSEDVGTQQMLVHENAQPTSAPAAGTAYAEENEHGHEYGEFIHAPDVVVYDRNGSAVNLSQFSGKPVVLNFWASWCGPCQSEMPDFQAKYNEHGNEINFVMVNVTDGYRETVESASAFIEQNGFNFPVFYDTSSEAAMVYQAFSLPTTYFIDAQGHIIAQAVGAIDAEVLQQGIDLISA